MVFFCFYFEFPSGKQRLSRERICSHNCTGCHTEINVSDQVCCCTKTQYTDTATPASSGTDSTRPGALQFVCLLVGCLTSQLHASVSQGRICSDNFTCCHAEIEVADQTFHLTQSQYTDTGPTSPSTDPITPGAWQGSHWSANWYDPTLQNSHGARWNPIAVLQKKV